MGSRGGVLAPTPEWQGYDISEEEEREWGSRFQVGKLAPEAPVPESDREMISKTE